MCVKFNACASFPFERAAKAVVMSWHTGAEAVLLLAEPGDLVLWDGRTIHGGRIGRGRIGELQPELARLSVAVSMVPRAWADDHVLATRRDGFLTGRTFNHSPHEAGTSEGTLESVAIDGWAPPRLSARQRALL